MPRDEALKKLEKPMYKSDTDKMTQLYKVAEKFGYTAFELHQIVKTTPFRTHESYGTDPMIKVALLVVKIVRIMKRILKSC